MTSNRQRKFLLGAATSSYQAEGGITNNDWHYFTITDSIRKRISKLTTQSTFYKGIRHIELQPTGKPTGNIIIPWMRQKSRYQILLYRHYLSTARFKLSGLTLLLQRREPVLM